MKQCIIEALGKLTQEQKQETWKLSLSGSQASRLIEEPYNLIREKLGMEREHPSKLDFFESDAGKEIANHAMSAGTKYESTVFSELKEHIPEAVSEDICYKKTIFYNNEWKENWNITGTPDWIIWNEDRTQALKLGDIKCSTAADDKKEMFKRYQYQLLHNCYVLNCFSSELDTKNQITKPLNRYLVNDFTQQDFEWYEAKLIEFFEALERQDYTYYDNLYNQQLLQDNNSTLEPMLYENIEPDNNTFNILTRLQELSNTISVLDKEKKELEALFKERFDNITMSFGNNTMILKSSYIKGGIDYTSMLNDLRNRNLIDMDYEDRFRKANTIRKVITFKGE